MTSPNTHEPLSPAWDDTYACSSSEGSGVFVLEVMEILVPGQGDLR